LPRIVTELRDDKFGRVPWHHDREFVDAIADRIEQEITGGAHTAAECDDFGIDGRNDVRNADCEIGCESFPRSKPVTVAGLRSATNRFRTELLGVLLQERAARKRRRNGKRVAQQSCSRRLRLEAPNLAAAADKTVGRTDLMMSELARSCAVADEQLSTRDDSAADLKNRFGSNADPIALDLASPNAARELFAQVPSCDVLINNAGFANNGKFAKLHERDILDEIQVNVVALTHLTRLYIPGMLDRRDGKILNVASTAAFLPGPNMAVYYATKAFVLSFSEALAHEVRGTGVTVTVLCPGATKTGFQKRANVESTMLFKLGMADAARVAKAGFDGMMRGKSVVVPGLANKLVALSPKISPRRLLIAISAKFIEPR